MSTSVAAAPVTAPDASAAPTTWAKRNEALVNLELENRELTRQLEKARAVKQELKDAQTRVLMRYVFNGIQQGASVTVNGSVAEEGPAVIFRLRCVNVMKREALMQFTAEGTVETVTEQRIVEIVDAAVARLSELGV